MIIIAPHYFYHQTRRCTRHYTLWQKVSFLDVLRICGKILTYEKRLFKNSSKTKFSNFINKYRFFYLKSNLIEFFYQRLSLSYLLQFDKKITLRLIVHDEILNSHMQNVTTFFFKTVTKHFLKGGFFSESAIRFSNLQNKSIPNYYPELEI